MPRSLHPIRVVFVLAAAGASSGNGTCTAPATTCISGTCEGTSVSTDEQACYNRFAETVDPYSYGLGFRCARDSENDAGP